MALITADLLNEDCSDISDWTNNDYGNGISEVDQLDNSSLILA